MKNLKQILCILAIGLITLLTNVVNAEEVGVQRLRAGAFIRVINMAEISTLVNDIDDEVVFVNPDDMYIYETNALPANTKIYGYVEDVLEPVAGRDGAIKILIYKIITPDKKVYRVTGHVYSENDNYIGGRETGSVYYRKVPHYIQGLKSMLQAAPLNIWEMGKHTIIPPGQEFFVILEEDMILK